MHAAAVSLRSGVALLLCLLLPLLFACHSATALRCCNVPRAAQDCAAALFPHAVKLAEAASSDMKLDKTAAVWQLDYCRLVAAVVKIGGASLTDAKR